MSKLYKILNIMSSIINGTQEYDTLILNDDSPVFFVAYNPGWDKWVSAEHTLSKRPIANGGAAVNT